MKASNSGEQRKFYYLATYICGFAAMAYFAMLSGQGWTAIAGCRQFFYARYADWLITTPLLILLLGLVAGAGVDVVAGAIGSDGVLNSFLCLTLSTHSKGRQTQPFIGSCLH